MKNSIQLILIALGSVAGFTSRTSLAVKNGVANSKLRIPVNRDPVVLWLTPEEERASVLSEYLARAHDERLKAIRAAEAKKDVEIRWLKEQLKAAEHAETSIRKKYESLLKEIGSTSPQSSAAPVASTSNTVAVASVKGTTESDMPATTIDVYGRRNSRIAAAASAGKQSRWGDMEVDRVTKVRLDVVSEPPSMKGAPRPAGRSSTTTLFQKRNAKVAAAAMAGKSRWGAMEIEKIRISGGVEAGVPTAVDDVRVGGRPSTLERVNLGAQLLGRS